MSSFVVFGSPGDGETCSHTSDDSNTDLYEANLPRSLANELRTFVSRGRSDSATPAIDATVEEESNTVAINVEGCTSPGSSYRVRHPLRIISIRS
jgi:hypothetical protein